MFHSALMDLVYLDRILRGEGLPNCRDANDADDGRRGIEQGTQPCRLAAHQPSGDTCPYRKSNPLAIDGKSGDAAARFGELPSQASERSRA
jgi:hypothetical protein